MASDRDEIYAGADLSEAEIAAARKFAAEKPSASYLQRKMGIPYSHAQRLLEYVEFESGHNITKADGTA